MFSAPHFAGPCRHDALRVGGRRAYLVLWGESSGDEKASYQAAAPAVLDVFVLQDGGQGVDVHRFAQPEVRQLHVPPFVQQQVVRLDVPAQLKYFGVSVYGLQQAPLPWQSAAGTLACSGGVLRRWIGPPACSAADDDKIQQRHLSTVPGLILVPIHFESLRSSSRQSIRPVNRA